ncbi:lipase family protein [Rhodococcus sp. ACT016]|uniref:lipase family protein n=1 Tax=Rhodococcus sp. ACT016 TaxID=3134808 RepID=UPI003D27FC56
MDTTVAAGWGPFVQAAYDQFYAAPGVVDPTSVALPAGFSLVRTIQMTDLSGTAPVFFGYLAAGGSPRVQVVALRGTATASEWVDDLHWAPVPFTQVSGGGRVAEGFLDLYETFATMVPGQSGAFTGTGGLVSAIDPAVPLVVTGHSLGSALSTLLVADLAANSALKPQAWTFASPKVGDANFAARYGQLSTVSWRIYNIVDPVPYFPLDPLDDFQHVNTGYAIDSLSYARWSLGCAHSLNTYLYGLSPATVTLDIACRK